jgi:hypothetical protein
MWTNQICQNLQVNPDFKYFVSISNIFSLLFQNTLVRTQYPYCEFGKYAAKPMPLTIFMSSVLIQNP